MPPERLTEIERQRRHREELMLAIAERLPLTTARRLCQERRRLARSRTKVRSLAVPAPAKLPPFFWWQRD